MRHRGAWGWVGAGAVLLLGVAATPSFAFDPGVEAQNYSKVLERQAIYSSPEGQLLLRRVSSDNGTAALQAQAADPERSFITDLCWSGFDGCAGDPRLYDWQRKGYGIVQPVLFTARNGATLSGHVWATRSGPPRKPGVVITNGSVQANEQLYWFAAQALAKSGYVVLTFDPQGQGQSDTAGEAPDSREGNPAQTDGRPFFDGTEDAINFFVSTPERPYSPVKSCSSGTSHAAKQARRVKAGLNAAFNPFSTLLDPTRLGIAGHSYGAAGVSYIGQWDPRVDAIVAWDNLGGTDPAGREDPCPGDPSARSIPPIKKPALGLSADYFLPPVPNLSQPNPLAKSEQSLAYSKAGVDTGELIIRGGSHFDFSFISNPGFGASLRGADLTDWYTTAWFDKYVKGDSSADARLLTDRWRHDGTAASVDPGRDGNDFSFYHRSRLDIHRSDGTRFTCEDLRPSCPGLADQDGTNGEYSYLALATSPDGQPDSDVTGAGIRSPARLAVTCVKGRRIAVRVPHLRGTRVTRVIASAGSRRVGASRGPRLTIRLRRPPRTTTRVRLRVTLRDGGRTRHALLTRAFRVCR